MSGEEVFLAVYDLSQGLARAMSGQFLGPDHALDIIPHTGIVVFGREYFYGGGGDGLNGGVQSCSPLEFRTQFGFQPLRMESLGRTSRTQREFENWCRTHPTYRTGLSYDLFSCNCNNFSNDAALHGLQLSRGVPRNILDIPNRVLSSPMGQFLRPLMEQMQLSANAPISGPTGLGSNLRSSPTMPPPSSTTTTTTTTTTTSTISTSKPPTPVLDKYDKPLLSADVAMVDICIQKLTKHESASSSSLHLLGQFLKDNSKTLKDNTPARDTIQALLRTYVDHSNLLTTKKEHTTIVFALMLLRLVVLKEDYSALSTTTTITDIIIQSISNRLTLTAESTTTNPFTSSLPVRCMAWCVLSNAIGAASNSSQTNPLFSKSVNSTDHFALLERLLEASVADTTRKETSPNKQLLDLNRSAAAFLYNAAHYLSVSTSHLHSSEVANTNDDAVPPLAVIILCGALGDEPDVDNNYDSTTILRCLLSASRILILPKKDGKTNLRSASVLQFCIELGFDDVLLRLSKMKPNGDDDEEMVKLASELHTILVGASN